MSDLLWLTDLDISGAETQSDNDELVQDTFHVLEQDLGSNLDDPTRGLGVANLLSKPLPNGITIAASNALADDTRVTRCDATIVTDPNGAQSLNVTIYTNDDVLNLPPVAGTSNVTVGGK